MFLFLTIGGRNDFSTEEFNNICEKYYFDIYKYCAARLDKSNAEDITHDVFFLFYKKRKIIENKNYKSWLYETANNLIKDFYKKQKRKIENEMYINESITEILSYEQNFELINDYEIEQYKNEILATLSDQERHLYNMNYIEKLSHYQIREKLSINEKTLEKRLYRLKQKIIIGINNKLNNHK